MQKKTFFFFFLLFTITQAFFEGNGVVYEYESWLLSDSLSLEYNPQVYWIDTSWSEVEKPDSIYISAYDSW